MVNKKKYQRRQTILHSIDKDELDKIDKRLHKMSLVTRTDFINAAIKHMNEIKLSEAKKICDNYKRTIL